MPLDICVICDGTKIQVHPHRQLSKQGTKWQPTKQKDKGPNDESRQRSKKGSRARRERSNKECNVPRVSVPPPKPPIIQSQSNQKQNIREIVNEHDLRSSTAVNGSKPVCQNKTSLISHLKNFANFGFTNFYVSYQINI